MMYQTARQDGTIQTNFSKIWIDLGCTVALVQPREKTYQVFTTILGRKKLHPAIQLLLPVAVWCSN